MTEYIQGKIVPNRKSQPLNIFWAQEPKELWGRTDSIAPFSHPKVTLNFKDQNDRKVSKENIPNQKPQPKNVAAQVRLSLKTTGKTASISPFFNHPNLTPNL